MQPACCSAPDTTHHTFIPPSLSQSGAEGKKPGKARATAADKENAAAGGLNTLLAAAEQEERRRSGAAAPAKQAAAAVPRSRLESRPLAAVTDK